MISFGDIQPKYFTPGKVDGTTMKNFHAFVSLQLLLPVPAKGCLPMGIAVGGSWADMKVPILLVPFPMRGVAVADYPIIQAGDSEEWSPDSELKKKHVSWKSQFQVLFRWPWLLAMDSLWVCFCEKPVVLPLSVSSPWCLNTASETEEISNNLNGWCLGPSVLSAGAVHAEWHLSMQNGICPCSHQGLQCTAWARGGMSSPLQESHMSLHTLLHQLMFPHPIRAPAKSGCSGIGELPFGQGLHCDIQAGKPTEVIWRACKYDMQTPSTKVFLGQAVFTWMWRAKGVQVWGFQGPCPKKPVVNPIRVLEISGVSCRGLNQGWSRSPASFLQVIQLWCIKLSSV